MPSDDFPTPGLKARTRKNGPPALVWIARADIVKQGFTPKTQKLPYTDVERDRAAISRTCLRLQAEMLEWAAGRRGEQNRFDGTVAGLSRRFQHDDASPFKGARFTTRKKDGYTLKIIEAAFGQRALASLKLDDFRRWYDAARKPKVEGGPERIRKAWGIMAMLRRMIAYGVAAELPECARLDLILSKVRFEQPRRRRVRLELKHVQAFIPKALELGRLSLAIGTAMQFETTMRQKDVIGEWAPLKPSEEPSGIVMNGRRWISGLTWSDLGSDYEVRKETTKTGAIVAHDLKLCPLVFGLLQKVPADRRIGPLIIDETAGRPFAESAYGREWRIVAKAAGVPDHVWNMDARAGGVSEADEAGAPTHMIQSQTGHSQAATTERYKRGGNLEGSRKVAQLRLAHRSAKNGA